MSDTPGINDDQGGGSPRRIDMSTFRITFSDDGFGVGKYLEYESVSPSSALNFVRRERLGRRAHIACDGKELASITCCNRSGDLWIVGPPQGRQPQQ
ncbi:hypothetical protein U4960_05120 [Altererythrobacter sp. H2]|uniref:hypothetical protein n=1 Tax=Altererythrobacter sp. H2 TaxID=3108391 RepID=UPI002B4BDDE2|nr:hypothetical protein [Altererythrobacter sp. H2]WRK96704.1 hypothetical protein U4960_05120 [Altererythrobacter sp. H2]